MAPRVKRPYSRRVYGATDLERFFNKVDVGLCWEWTASLNRKGGYGSFRVGGRLVSAHRWLWETLVGPIPAKHDLDHLCRNRRCVNPDHLEPVTRSVNLARGIGYITLDLFREIALTNRWKDRHAA